jgi:hypothetical protein
MKFMYGAQNQMFHVENKIKLVKNKKLKGGGGHSKV